ncbi:MAG: hypothetical protein Q4E06_06410 [Lautropia sp.]|nr:hypothetical protein [Lautropia sp.]
MPPHLIKTTIAGTLTLAWTLAAAQDAAPPAPPDFKPTAGCETVEGYDPHWATHGDDYGLGGRPAARKPKAARQQKERPEYIWGFYQMHVHEGTLYATFGGASRKGVTPGALVMLDADTLRYRDAIPLPFAAHALSVDRHGRHAIATHTAANAFSIIDLERGSADCRKADTHLNGVELKGRYVRLDEQGNFYINYNGFGQEGASAVVMKYAPDGEHARGFIPQPTGAGLVIPLAYLDGKVLSGNRALQSVDPANGAVSTLARLDDDSNIYNYVAGPGKRVLGSDNNIGARPNLVLIDPETGTHRGLFTGIGAVEVAYLPEAGQAFSTNFNGHSVTVAALPQDASAFRPGQFVNIRFAGKPATLAVRRTRQGTDVFVSEKYWDKENATLGAQLRKIHIAASVQGIDGIERPGACTISTFDMKKRTVSAPRPCPLLDERASYQLALDTTRAALKEGRGYQKKIDAELPRLRAELHRARQKVEKDPSDQNRQAVDKLQKDLDAQQHFGRYLERNRVDGEAGLQKIRQLLGG